MCNSETLVDTVRGTVFQGETYKGRSVGTATIFLGDARISTNVMTADGQRALGTRVSPEVREHVLGKGKLWTDRAFVVSDWYITAYRPIEDISSRRVGMLYVGVLDPEPTDINRLATASIALVEYQALVKGVALKFTPGESLPELIVDRSQIQSVLINIIINALDATGPGGAIRVFTAAGLTSREAGRTGVEITVADTGCGIPSENLDKLFEPFFTTKVVGQGTGLGLAVSLGIIQRHGGRIRVQSEIGKGSRFFIWLPAGGKGEHESAGG
jgi:hypothetical protein